MGIVPEEGVQLLMEGHDDGVHHGFNPLHGAVNILPGNARGAHAVIGVEDFQGGGQVVVHKGSNLRELFRVGHYLINDLAGGVLQLVNAPGDDLILNGVVQPAHLLQGPVLFLDQSIYFGVSRGGRGFFLGLLGGVLRWGFLFRSRGRCLGLGVRHFIGYGGENALCHNEDHGGQQDNRHIVGDPIQRVHQGKNHPDQGNGVNRDDRALFEFCHGGTRPFQKVVYSNIITFYPQKEALSRTAFH